MKVTFFKSPDFAITPEFFFENPIISVILDFANDTIIQSLSIEAIAKDLTGNFSFKGVLTVTENSQDITLTNVEGSSLQLVDLERLFQANGLVFKGFLPHSALFQQIKSSYLTNLNIKVTQFCLS